jgi:hypothetical protein
LGIPSSELLPATGGKSKLRDTVKGIIGKRIKGVVAKKRLGGGPHYQLFLIFSDETYFEFWSPKDCIIAAGGIDKGGFKAVRKYMGEESIVFEACDESIGDEDMSGNRNGNPNKDFEQIQNRRGGLSQGELDTQAIIEAKDVESVVKIAEKQVPWLNTSNPEYRNLTPEKKMERISSEIDRQVENASGLSMEEIYKRAGLGAGKKPVTNEEAIKVMSEIYEGVLEASSTQAQSGTWGDAVDALEKRDYATAYRISRPLAEQGHAKAQTSLGYMYTNGKGVPQDHAEAEKWYRKAAEQGDAEAQFNLGFMCSDGRGVPQDSSEAAKWYLKAAEQGHAVAQCTLGIIYNKGEGVPQDISEAAKWCRKAAEQGVATSQYMLGGMYANGQGVQQDYVLTKMWWDLAVSRISVSDLKETVISQIDLLASEMTPAQIIEAERLAREWKPKKEEKEIGIKI